MKFKLECTDDRNNRIVVEFEEVALYEVVQNIQTFLTASGFQLKNLDYDVPSS